MVAFGVLTPREAVAAIDFHTLALLFGMMIVIAHLRLAGFFRWLASRALHWAHAPLGLLVLVVWLSGLLPARFVNDTVCLLLTPLVLDAAGALGRNPVPFLLAVAMGSNVGSVATIVGNPQNMMVASFSGLSYVRFLVALAPVAIVGLVLTSILLALAYRREPESRRARSRLGAPHHSPAQSPARLRTGELGAARPVRRTLRRHRGGRARRALRALARARPPRAPRGVAGVRGRDGGAEQSGQQRSRGPAPQGLGAGVWEPRAGLARPRDGELRSPAT